MAHSIGDYIQTDNWKNEKHVPVIDCADSFASGEMQAVKVTIGKEVSHPNTTAHHIRWISLFFHPEGEKFGHQIGQCTFDAHGESGDGPDEGPVYTHHEMTVSISTTKPGTLHAMSYCNIHGLWQSSKEIALS